MSHILIRALCLLIIEYECVQFFSPPSRALIFNSSLAAVYLLGFIIIMINRKIGFIIGIIGGSINIIVKIIVVVSGHEHFPYWPIVWITQSALVIYFCAVAFMAARRDNN
jgi:hypothetical protein